MKTPSVKFPSAPSGWFYDTLKKRVDQYFQSRNISKYGNAEMVIKTIVVLLLFLAPYTLILTGIIDQVWLYFLLWSLMGLGVTSIGLSIMHDANHGTYSRNKKLNSLLGKFMDVIGGNSMNWKIQHNLLHHVYTNVEGLDEDIDPKGAMRLSPHSPRYKIHKFQFLYAWLLYGMMTLFWITMKDYKQLVRYHKQGLLQKQQTNLRKEMTRLVLFKLFYIGYMIVLPFLLSGMPWYWSLVGFLIMHFTSGLSMAAIFQSAHVVHTAEFPAPKEGNNMENNWALHQLLNTANFSPRSRIFSWFVGGLNYQIEHHLFPQLCHVHYRKVSKLVQQVAREYGLPYHVQPTFVHALISHTKMLYRLGKKY